MSGSRRLAAVVLATAVVLAAFLGGRAARSDDEGSAGSAPAAEVEDAGKGESLGTAAGLPRLRRDRPTGGTGSGGTSADTPAPDTGTGSTANDSPGTQQTQQPQPQSQTPDPPSNDTEDFGGGTN